MKEEVETLIKSLREYADKLEAELENVSYSPTPERKKVIKCGVLKHDIYLCNDEDISYHLPEGFWGISKEEARAKIDRLLDEHGDVIEAGTLFYLSKEDDEERWSSKDEQYIFYTDEDFERRHLKEVEEVLDVALD